MWRGRGGDDDDEIDEVASMDGSESIASSRGSNIKKGKHSEDGETEEDDQDEYDDAEFDGYSDEFDSDGGEGDDDAEVPKPQGTEPSTSQTTVTNRWKVGDRVQVFWENEREWFDGTISRVEPARCFVDYTDGEQQWEPANILRVAPPSQPDDVKQLQQMNSKEISELCGRRVSMYWTEEASWFDGTIRALDPTESPTRICVLYDDGDEQWVSQQAFKCVLLMPPPLIKSQPTPQPLASISESVHHGGSSVPARNEKVLVARKYTPALENHFEPVRVARPYKCVVENHIGTIVTPRHRDIAASTEDIYQSYSVDMQCESVTQDCQIQTEINTSASSA